MKKKVLVVILWKKTPESQEKLVLLLQRPPSEGSYWQSVTGGVEEGEDPWEAARREAEEETGFASNRWPQPLGLSQEFLGRWGEAQESAFFLTLLGGDTPPVPRLDAKEHVDYRWLSPKEALQTVKFPFNAKCIERATQGLPPLHLSRGGIFRQEGEEISHERTVQLLHRSLVEEKGHYLVRIGKEELEVVVETCPRFIKSFDQETGKIFLLGGYEETLDPTTLFFHPCGALHCRLQNGWEARFMSAAYYSLAKNIREEKKQNSVQYVLHLFGRDYKLSVPK